MKKWISCANEMFFFKKMHSMYFSANRKFRTFPAETFKRNVEGKTL